MKEGEGCGGGHWCQMLTRGDREKRNSRGEGNDEQRKKAQFSKRFFFLLQKKDPSRSPLTSTTDVPHPGPDRCAGGCRQESSLCVGFICIFYACVCVFRNVKTESRSFCFLFCVSLSWRQGVRVQCGCWQNELCMSR